MLISTLALALTIQSIPTPGSAPICRDPKVQFADRVDAKARLETLNRQPLADQEKAVMYRENGCLKPVLVREDVGTEQR